jgi:hypothetical protein
LERAKPAESAIRSGTQFLLELQGGHDAVPIYRLRCHFYGSVQGLATIS